MGIAGLAARLRAHFGWDGPAPPGQRRALVFLSGLPGTGKSHLAAAVAARQPAVTVRTDEVRKALFHPPTYSSGESGVVYLTCYALLEALLADGYSVIFDATNLTRAGRKRLRKIAGRAGAPILRVETAAPAEVVARRLERRAAGELEPFSSDADWPVYQRLAAGVEPASGEEGIVVDTSGDIAPAVTAIISFVQASATGGRPPVQAECQTATRAAGGQRPEGGQGVPGSRSFHARLVEGIVRQDSLLCIGLDPEIGLLPAHLRALPPGEAVLTFNRQIIESTADLAVAYKPNLAFYESLGPAGLEALRSTLRLIPSGLLAIGDAKRGDIANTMRHYARALFDVYGFDAVTASPYLGKDALAPFFGRADRGIFVLCRTSNPGAAEITDLDVAGQPLFLKVAERVQAWNENDNLGLVVGATVPEELAAVRQICPQLPVLLPGVGAQGGDLEAAVRAGLDGEGAGLLVAAARQILYASSGDDFPLAARRVASDLRDRINRMR